MSVIILFCVILSCVAGFTTLDERFSVGYFQNNVCDSKVGIDWLLSQRTENYGWGSQTHRAIIAVFTAVLEKKIHLDETEMNLMAHQLEVQLSTALIRNNGVALPVNELAFYIHALMIVEQNPKNFKGINLIGLLEQQMSNPDVSVNPFSVLCLCNAGVIKRHYLDDIFQYLPNNAMETIDDIEKSAITLKAFACADTSLTKHFKDQMRLAASVLAKLQQNDGSFGNSFTTSLVVQALKATASHHEIVNDALDYLSQQNSTKLVDVYYIQMALRKFVFIKDYRSPQNYTEVPIGRENKFSLHYSVKIGSSPDTFITISMNLPVGSTLLDVMSEAEKNSDVKFLHTMSKDGKSYVYSIINLPNNAEDGLYWRLFSREKDCYSKDCEKELTRPVNQIPIRQDDKYTHQYMDLFM